jgi:hypothetical protein
MYTRPGDLTSTCWSGVHASGSDKSTANPYISAVDFRAPAGFIEIFNLLKAQRMCRPFARLSRTCQLKSSAKSRQTH